MSLLFLILKNMTSPISAPESSIVQIEWSDRLFLDGLSEKAMELLKDGGEKLVLPQALWGVEMTTRELFNAIVRIAYPQQTARNFQIEQEEFQWEIVYRVSLPALCVDGYMLIDSVENTPEKAVSKWIENFMDVLRQHEDAGDLSEDIFSIGGNTIKFNPQTKTFERA